jgi:hypothetical protein
MEKNTMSLIKTALTAAALTLVAVSANAQTYTAPVSKPVISQDARNAHGSTVIVKEKAPFSRESLERFTSN